MQAKKAAKRVGRARRGWFLVGAVLVATASYNPPLRTAPAGIIHVTTTGDWIDPTDGACSLQEAIYSANFDDNIVPASFAPFTPVDSECEPGSGDDTIVLQAGAVYNITAIQNDPYNPLGPTATPIVLSNITIEGNGARIERANPNLDFTGLNFRAFAVSNTYQVTRLYVRATDTYLAIDDPNLPVPGSGIGNLTIRNLHVKGFTAKGGNGAEGGGGGLGAGGAIYVLGGNLTVESSTFLHNGAGGGNGSAGSGGGGGGLGGHGGDTIDLQSSGGGGGGSRGHGAGGHFEGGGGGGTQDDGVLRAAGFRCGGKGGDNTALGIGEPDGASVVCAGGGGGGGSRKLALFLNIGNGGHGNYGGGGGGGGYPEGDGGDGGFGGGGGGGWSFSGTSGSHGGDAGFGGGGGAGDVTSGDGGTFAGNGNADTGGAGAGLGGAIFADQSNVVIRNSTFTRNYAVRGEKANGGNSADDGGGAIFAVDGTLKIFNATVAANETTGDSAGVMMYRSTRPGSSAALELRNTIISQNITTTNQCDLQGGVSYSGSGNLIDDSPECTGAVSGAPLLGALQMNPPGVTQTMSIGSDSAAYDTGDAAHCQPTDQRGVSRPQSFGCDIGAFEFLRPSADLAIAKRALGTAVAGLDLSYAIDVHNNGPTQALAVSVTDTLPAGVTFVSMNAPGFSCSGTSVVTCTKSAMSAGEIAALTMNVRVGASVAHGTTLTNSVNVASTTEDPVPANNAASVSSSVIALADLGVTKTPASIIVAGGDLTYTIVATNNGPSDGKAIEVSDTIPAGTTFRGLVEPSGWTCTKPAVGAAGPALVKCTRATLAPQGTGTLSLVIRPGSSLGEGTLLCNTAAVTTTTTDPVAANNSSQSCGVVQTRADLALTQSATTTGKAGKGTATFTLLIRNNGPSDAQNISLVATSSLFIGPPGPIVTASGATCTVANQTVSCTWSSLAASATTTAVIAVPWRSAVGQVCDVGTVSAGTIDPNATNNTASACIGKR